jgi:hypothetical protein
LTRPLDALERFDSARYFFLTVNLLRSKSKLEERDFQGLAFSVARMQEEHGSGVQAEDRLRAPASRSEGADLSPIAADRTGLRYGLLAAISV